MASYYQPGPDTGETLKAVTFGFVAAVAICLLAYWMTIARPDPVSPLPSIPNPQINPGPDDGPEVEATKAKPKPSPKPKPVIKPVVKPDPPAPETYGPATLTTGPTWVRLDWTDGAAPPTPSPVVPTPPVVVPQPPPQPSPAPPAILPTMTGQAWMVAVVDPAVPLPLEQQALVKSKSLPLTLGAMTIAWQVRRKGDPVLKQKGSDLQTWEDLAVKAGLPALVVIGNAGHKVDAYPLASDEQTLVSQAKHMRGN